jgi:hypothetical protein
VFRAWSTLARLLAIRIVTVRGGWAAPVRSLHKSYPDSVLAGLYKHGLEYSSAMTPFPSDSSPGMVAQVTGGDPRVAGIYYDDTFNHDVFPAGTTNCTGPVPGGEAAYEEAIDTDSNSLDAGQRPTNLPGSILSMTGDPTSLLNPKAMPVDPTTCKPIYPDQYLKVNTVFNVAARTRSAPRRSSV